VVTLALAAPERDPKRLAALFTERLGARGRCRARDHAGADGRSTACVYRVQCQPVAAGSRCSLGSDWLQLAETLHARLGSERVFQLQAVDDHRPERAWRAVPLSIDGSEAKAPALQSQHAHCCCCPRHNRCRCSMTSRSITRR